MTKDVFSEVREPAVQEGRTFWMLGEWRRVSIPQWRRILAVSIEQGNSYREEYARWMLSTVLLPIEM